MHLFLGLRISRLVASLKKEGEGYLAACIESNWNKTAILYSQELNTYSPSRAMEKEMLDAFHAELERLDLGKHSREILASLEKRRVLQTAPHLGVTENPRMLCINWLGSLGVPADEFYIACMFSGIPFSNKSHPGRINRKEDSINLFPSNLQDGLVYRSIIPQKLCEAMDAGIFPADIIRQVPKVKVGESYTKWALQACQYMERHILKKNNLVYLDINEVVSNYLADVLKNPSHVISKIFFNKATREEFVQAFPEESLFCIPITDGKYEKMENLYLGDALVGKTRKIELTPEAIVSELKTGRLCPTLLTTFFCLAFLNEFKCFGSFRQVEYLPAYQAKLSKLSFLKEFHIENIPTANLTTGIFKKGTNMYPADIMIEGKEFSRNEKTLFGELIIDMKDVLLEN